MQKYYTIKEVAEHLKVSTQTVRNWIKKGDLEAAKLKHAVRISEENLKKILK